MAASQSLLVRVPEPLRSEFLALVSAEYTSASAVLRKAVLDYVRSRKAVAEHDKMS